MKKKKQTDKLDYIRIKKSFPPRDKNRYLSDVNKNNETTIFIEYFTGYYALFLALYICIISSINPHNPKR